MDLPSHCGPVYTAAMKLGSSITRVLFALWLCIGTQVHVAVDHAAMFNHVAHQIADVLEHANHVSDDEVHASSHEHDTPHHHDVDTAPAPVSEFYTDTLCCYETPKHQHHGGGSPHAHLNDALITGPSQRSLSFLHAAVLPLRAIEVLPQTAPILPAVTVALPSEPPATHNAALRGPPLA